MTRKPRGEMLRIELSHQRLLEVVQYDKSTGDFSWRAQRRRGPRRVIGSRAGYQDEKGYIKISVDGREHKAHRLAWFYVTGEWPPNFIDHVNGRRADNRWANLRLATQAENQQNRKPKTGSASGLLGVHWNKQTRKWRSVVCLNKRTHYVGSFASRTEAYAATLEAKKRIHAFWASNEDSVLRCSGPDPRTEWVGQ